MLARRPSRFVGLLVAALFFSLSPWQALEDWLSRFLGSDPASVQAPATAVPAPRGGDIDPNGAPFSSESTRGVEPSET